MGAEQRNSTRRRAIPWVMLALWIGVLALASPFASKLGDVTHDRVTDYLPASADSTQVAKIQQELPGGQTTELVLVYHRDTGLTAADRATAVQQLAKIGTLHPLAATPRGVLSADGTTLMYPVTSNWPGTDEKKRTTLVDDIRQVAHDTGGLTVDVGGPGALATDSGKVFESLGGPCSTRRSPSWPSC